MIEMTAENLVLHVRAAVYHGMTIILCLSDIK